MWSTLRTAAVIVALAAVTPTPLQLFAQQPGAWTTIFDGTSLKGWNMVGDADWMLADGAVQAQRGMGGFLVSSASYGDFQLTFDIWVSDDANSGVFIRCDDPKTITAMNAYEVNVYDRRPDQAYRTGAIVDVAKPMVNINAGGRWNTFDITARGTKLIVVLNGMKTVEVDDKSHARGPIALQYGAGVVKFRNVRIRNL
jgi:hypothetical protein